MRTVAMLMAMCVVAMVTTGCLGGADRTVGNPLKSSIKECTNCTVTLNLYQYGGENQGDQTKTTPVTPSISAAASQSGTADSSSTPTIDAKDAGTKSETNTVPAEAKTE